MTMGEKILMLRKSRGWNQEDLAEQIGVTRQAVSRWESDSAKPDADKIIGLCDLFDVSADYLLRDRHTKAQTDERSEERKPASSGETDWKLPPKRWFAWVAVAFGGITIFLMWLTAVTDRIDVYFCDGVSYNGFSAFLKYHDVELLCILALTMLFGGGIYLAVPWIGKLLE